VTGSVVGLAYYHPRLFTGHRRLDTILDVWYGACTRSGPPRWQDILKRTWDGSDPQKAVGGMLQSWCIHLVLSESRHWMQPALCAELFSVAARC
jgi:hypothetical protein